MSLFGLGRPNPEKLKAAGDVEALSRLLADERLRAEALDALIALATEPSHRQHNRAALQALGQAREGTIRRLTKMLQGISSVEGGWRNSAVIEGLVALGAVEPVVDYWQARATGSSADGLFMLDVLNLLTIYAMARRDRPLLRRLLENGAYEYREAQAQRSFTFGHLQSELPGWVPRSMEVMAELGGEAELIELGERARSETVRHWAWGALGTTGSAASLPLIVQAAETGGQHGTWAFAELVARLPVADLVPLARHPRRDIREPALLQLCAREDPSAFDTILAAASSDSEKVSLAAIGALGGSRRPEAVPALVPLLRSPSADVWKAAAAALGPIGGEAAISALLALDMERLLDEVVLKAVAKAGGGRRLLQVVAPRFEQLAPEQALDLVAGLRGWLPASDLAGLQATLARTYVVALGDSAWGKRKAAIKALGKIGGSAATEALRSRQAQEEDYELSKEISDALAAAGR